MSDPVSRLLNLFDAGVIDQAALNSALKALAPAPAPLAPAPAPAPGVAAPAFHSSEEEFDALKTCLVKLEKK